MKAISQQVASGNLNPNDINEALVHSFLTTKNIPDPELLIRTSGEYRISNFLLWQIAYSELFITDVLWPDFRKINFYEAILDYQKRERRFRKLRTRGCRKRKSDHWVVEEVRRAESLV